MRKKIDEVMLTNNAEDKSKLEVNYLPTAGRGLFTGVKMIMSAFFFPFFFSGKIASLPQNGRITRQID